MTKPYSRRPDTTLEFWKTTALMLWTTFKLVVQAQWMIFFVPKYQPFAVEFHNGIDLKTVWAHWDDGGLYYD